LNEDRLHTDSDQKVMVRSLIARALIAHAAKMTQKIRRPGRAVSSLAQDLAANNSICDATPKQSATSLRADPWDAD